MTNIPLMCDHCKNNEICKFTEPLHNLYGLLEDWEYNNVSEQIVDINISCKYRRYHQC